MTFHVPEKYRLTSGAMRSTPEYGNNGVFIIRMRKFKHVLNVQASDGDGWEHVSVSTPTRSPNWIEMCCIKNLFWDEDDFVVQMHVPKSDYINCHPHCLHLWRKCGTNDYCERPHHTLVGYKCP